MARSIGEIDDLAYIYKTIEALQKIAARHAGTDALIYTLTMAKVEAEDLMLVEEGPTHGLMPDRQEHPEKKQ